MIDFLLGRWRCIFRKRKQRTSENEENLQNTRHTATCIDWVAELAPCCTKTKWRHIIPHLPPVTSVKNTGTRREIARVRHESSFISCYQRCRSTCRGAMHLQKCTRVCVSPRKRRNDAGLLSLQNRFTWPASDKSSPGTVGYPLFTPFMPPRLLAFVYLLYVCQDTETGSMRNVTCYHDDLRNFRVRDSSEFSVFFLYRSCHIYTYVGIYLFHT